MGMNPFFKEKKSGHGYGKNYGSMGFGKGQPEKSDELDEVKSVITKLNRMADLNTKDFADLNGYAARVAKVLNKESNSQLRKFFEPLVEIETMLKRGESWVKVEGKLHMSIPMLAYAVGRNLVPKSFFELMEACIKKVDVQGLSDIEKMENFARFMEFLRAIVAYNKYFKGD